MLHQVLGWTSRELRMFAINDCGFWRIQPTIVSLGVVLSRAVYGTVRVDVHLGATGEQELEDLERSGLGAVVQGRVALDALAVDVGAQFDQVAGDLQVALVAGDHQTRVAVPIRHLDVYQQTKDTLASASSGAHYRAKSVNDLVSRVPMYRLRARSGI